MESTHNIEEARHHIVEAMCNIDENQNGEFKQINSMLHFINMQLEEML